MVEALASGLDGCVLERAYACVCARVWREIHKCMQSEAGQPVRTAAFSSLSFLSLRAGLGARFP